MRINLHFFGWQQNIQRVPFLIAFDFSKMLMMNVWMSFIPFIISYSFNGIIGERPRTKKQIQYSRSQLEIDFSSSTVYDANKKNVFFSLFSHSSINMTAINVFLQWVQSIHVQRPPIIYCCYYSLTRCLCCGNFVSTINH